MTNIQQFTGWQYLLIDCANHYGLDKELYESRILWVETNLHCLEDIAEGAPDKTRPLYLKAVQAIRAAQAGKPIGHLVGFDAICSGMQIMSCLTGCYSGAKATGLIEPNHRSDAYTEVTEEMGKVMGGSFLIDRSDIKQGVMTCLYGSKAKPKELFGDETPELAGFYQALYNVAPGASDLLQVLLDSWQAFALKHEWQLPDGHLASIKNMVKQEEAVTVPELGNIELPFEWYENEGVKSGVANAANVIHSIDAYLLRTLIRRCNYDVEAINQAADTIETILLERELGIRNETSREWFSEEFCHLAERYELTQMPDIRILSFAQEQELRSLGDIHLRQLARICDSMLVHKPFPILSVHDEFKCHANNMNHLRQHYVNILKEMCKADILGDILSTIHGTKGSYQKRSNDLADQIIGNYAIN